jgi:predicted dehydrogenase
MKAANELSFDTFPNLCHKSRKNRAGIEWKRVSIHPIVKRYKIAQVGIGNRGKVHANAILSLPNQFELVGLCDLDRPKLDAYAAAKGLPPGILFDDAERMVANTHPDVFCFVTPPAARLPLVELAVRYRVKGLAFEKPMANSLAEAWEITRLCREHGVKAVVSHQHKYLASFQKVKEILDAGEIGAVNRIDASCQAWLAQLGTHYMDYILWANGGGRARWVVGHVHGKELLSDSHPSPNYALGVIGFENGVRSVLELGRLAPSYMPPQVFWLDDRLTAYGTHGYAWCDPDGRWGALTRASGGEVVGGQGDTWADQEATRLQPPYFRDLHAWLEDDSRGHPCCVELAYHGYEILTGLCLSALDRVRVDLPLDPARCEDVFERMRCELPECPERREA